MPMQPFTSLTAPAAGLMRANIDTDVIIRIERIAQLSKAELGDVALEALRFRPDGSHDPSFVLNRPEFSAAAILLAGANFGCGSSREHAVWALQGMGLRCIIAPSFGDIFYANCFQNGVLPLCLPLEVVERLASQCNGGAPLTVDLQTCTITTPSGEVIPFTTDARRRDALLRGLDDIGMTLADDGLIRAWQRADRVSRPWAWPDPTVRPI